MRDVPGPILLEETPLRHPVQDVRLLVELPSWPRVFLSNFRDLVLPRRQPRLQLRSAPAPFWPDVFVGRGLPWLRFLESGACHILAFVLLISLSRFFALQPQPTPRSSFDHAQVIYYQPAEYLPPLDTRRAGDAAPQKADPEFSPQPIISVPPEADNHTQTIVTPPNIKLKRDVPLPNIVAWSEKPQLPIAPAPLVPASSISRIRPQLENSVVAPPPDVHTSSPGSAFQASQPSVIEPPPSVDSTPARPLGDLNIAHTSVIAPAPQLSIAEQRAIPGAVSGQAGSTPQVVPPPPSLSASGSASGSSVAGGRIIALNLHPTVGAPPDPPQGNRRGSFAATPEGHPGASGNPGASSANAGEGTGGHGSGNHNGSGSNGKGTGDLPAGLYVGNAANPSKTSAVAGDPAPKTSATVNPNLIASARPPSVGSAPARALQPESETKLSQPEREIFGARKFYSLTLNMPNLNSAGGSWIIRFAELREDAKPGSLSAPYATRKVDPGYPLELMRQNLAGTVILYAVIHADGTVGDIRVLRSVDDRLDQFATQAVSKWQFQPATKNGSPVDVEATFQIPFRPARTNF